MKKIIGLLAIFVILVPGIVSAQSETLKTERYYTGIGATFYKVEESVSRFIEIRDGETVEFDNSSGKFTGLIVLSRLLEDGPAQKAQLKSGDVLVAVDDEDASSLGVEGVIKKISSKAVGETISLRIRIADSKGNMSSELVANVAIETIDRASWVPKGVWFKSSLSTCDTRTDGMWVKAFRFASLNLIKTNRCRYDVRLETMISQNKDTGRLIYHYRMVNYGGHTVIVRSDVLDIASGIPSNLVELRRGRVREFIVISDEFPVEVSGLLIVHQKPDKQLLRYQLENGFEIPADNYWSGHSRGSTTGFVPYGHLVKHQERNK